MVTSSSWFGGVWKRHSHTRPTERDAIDFISSSKGPNSADAALGFVSDSYGTASRNTAPTTTPLNPTSTSDPYPLEIIVSFALLPIEHVERVDAGQRGLARHCDPDGLST